jgi:hypothetical protein
MHHRWWSRQQFPFGIGLLLLSLSLAASAQERDPEIRDSLINLESPTTPARHTFLLHGDGRVFGGHENTAYGTLQVRYGLQDNLEVALRGAVGGDKTFTGPGFTIRHGGHDFEVTVKYRLPRSPHAALMVGISAPDTPSQNGVYGTSQLLFEHPVGTNTTLYFTPKAVFVPRPIVGIGGGVRVRMSRSVQFVGDVTGIVIGDNTHDTITGSLQQDLLYGVGLRFTSHSPARDLVIDIGFTNTLGGTTGFSLTPGLGGSGAFMIGLTLQR